LIKFGIVIPAKAGIQSVNFIYSGLKAWIPAFAGMTALEEVLSGRGSAGSVGREAGKTKVIRLMEKRAAGEGERRSDRKTGRPNSHRGCLADGAVVVVDF